MHGDGLREPGANLWRWKQGVWYERMRSMENSICISKTLLSKQRDREQYWGAYRWHGRAKAAFYFGLINAIGNSIFLSVFTAILFLDPYAKNEIGYILLCIFCWLFMVFFALLMIFQDRIFANKSEKFRKKLKGNTKVYLTIEFYSDHFVANSELHNMIYQVPYSSIIEYKETKNYCILFTSNGTAYMYGKEEFVQGTAAEAYALISQYCNCNRE